MSGGLQVVYFDVGGPIYDDSVYARALLDGLRELGVTVDDDEFWARYERCQAEQAGFTRPIANAFGVDPRDLEAVATQRWRYSPESLFSDVLPTLERLSGGYRLGVLANQPRATRDALERDGVAPYIDLWVVSAEVGFSKPDPRLFAYAVELSGCDPQHVAFVGNRLDNDIAPARESGMYTVWLLRGEAPPMPTESQRAGAHAVVRTLASLPQVLAEADI